MFSCWQEAHVSVTSSWKYANRVPGMLLAYGIAVVCLLICVNGHPFTIFMMDWATIVSSAFFDLARTVITVEDPACF